MTALPTSAAVLERARDAVLAALLASSADAAWSSALSVVLGPVDVTGMARSRVDVAPVLELAEVAATLATMLGRREVMILTDGEWADARPSLPSPAAEPDEGGSADG